jgi:CheY-like chemotaxis protein
MNRTALVAEDDAAVLESVAAALESLGMKVRRVENGAQLIQCLAEEGPFHLMVTDIALPWMTGLQAARSARNAGLTMPILFVTALPDGKLAEEISTLGQESMLLRKPFATSDLITAVKSLLPASG